MSKEKTSGYKKRVAERRNGLPPKSRAHEFVPWWCVQPIHPKGILGRHEVEAEIQASGLSQRAFDAQQAAQKAAQAAEMAERAALGLKSNPTDRPKFNRVKVARPRSTTEARSVQLTQAAILSAFGC